MEGELLDWEVLQNSDSDSNSIVVNSPELRNLEEIEGDTDGMIRSDYFSLDNQSMYAKVGDASEEGSVESDNPSWIDPGPETRYERKNLGEFWSDSGSDRSDDRKFNDSDVKNELGFVENEKPPVDFEGIGEMEAKSENSGKLKPDDSKFSDLDGKKGLGFGEIQVQDKDLGKFWSDSGGDGISMKFEDDEKEGDIGFGDFMKKGAEVENSGELDDGNGSTVELEGGEGNQIDTEGATIDEMKENINDTNNLEICREGSVGDDSVPETIGDDRSATLSKDGNLESEVSKSDLIVQNDDKLIQMEGPEIGKGTSRRKKKYRVDILRCESLAALPKTTLDRLFLRDYDIVVSMVPLPYSSVLPGPTGPINFGPPSHSSMTPWMKLVLYSTVASGPLSVVLMKGQCLRMLPAPLAGCEKALLWSWDGSTIGGLGGKFEGNLVKGSVLLHCLNSLLKCSAVIVQPFSRYDLDGSGKVVTLDIPLPLKNSDGSVALVGDELGLCAEECSKLNDLLTDLAHKIELWTVGYIRLLKLFKERESDHFAPDEEKYEWVPLSIEFGMPLFSPKLCNNICERIVTSRLLQADSLTEQHDSMQSIRKRLRDVCAEYQATGPAAKLLYQKEHQKDHSKELSKLLMNYASGRWNPLLDPSSPISGASSEHQRLKLASRQRCRTEVLSFDGSILRSYALTPVYEAATRPIDDSTPVTATKVDPDETDSKEIILPGVNLLFDGAELHPFDIGACLQARQPISLIAEAASASTSFAIK